ncbi:2-oxoacid:ferredoxin oxidoreductase subunit alpha [Nanobdella aerobiophila]|uniref:2-oxoacid:ferredoxin oxidoreductase subunit alpha n=1 Tax=Nanobdella aerobiophila TaxID=2586965 RepID=A0A915SSP5_9ARCH|nr:2-oxoacid:acceptor oxidoreductase subunit alpha [Nanobdella aerobiophila]BBL45531.1 2-oxoacid:ferredoxin oxidoreductase subunit alpha [Nanobdella aerobiophila]
MADINILIGGQAGQGIEFTADIISKIFIKMGYNVFNYRWYMSLIRGGHNYNIVTISKEKIYTYDNNDFDYIIAFDQNTINIHKDKLKETGSIFGNKSIIYNKKIDVDTYYYIKKYNINRKYENTIILTYFLRYLNIDKSIVEEIYKEKIKDPEELKIIDYIYNDFNNNSIKVDKNNYEKQFYLSGSEAIALGAIAAGLDLYIAYPMTPASTILSILASLKDKYNYVTYQPDNEIGVINIGLGASYGGAKVMIGSSGGGIDLMSEAISLSGMSEIPIVIAWGQRYGPSTGMATHTDQSDLLEALNIGHGEFPRIVISPGDAAEAFERTIEAFHLAYKYNVPAMILFDLFMGESKTNFKEIYSPNIEVSRYIDLDPPKEYKNYKITKEGYQLRAIPGFDSIVKAVSYEHDEFGIETEEPDIGQAMSEKRLNKMKIIEKEVNELEPYRIYGSGNKIIISWGSNKMPILESLKYLKGWKFLQISYLSPFPKEIKYMLEEANKIVDIEHNLTGQLAKLVKQEIGIDIEDKILKHTGDPFTAQEIVNNIKNL